MVKNLVTFGGGTGHSAVIGGMRDDTQISITAVCTSSDDGSDTGSCVKDYGRSTGINGSLGDAGKLFVSMSPNRDLAEVLNYRFPKGCRKNQTVKNSFLMSCIAQRGFDEGFELMHKLCGLAERHRVVAATKERTHLRILLEGGNKLNGEHDLDTLGKHKYFNLLVHKVKRVRLHRKVNANPAVLEAIGKADVIATMVGDLFTSVIPSLLPVGIPEGIQAAPGKFLIMVNLMTKVGETDEYNASDFVRQISRVAGRKPDIVLCNSNGIPAGLLARYRSKEQKVKLTVVPDSFMHEFPGVKLVCEDLWGQDNNGHIIHDPVKTARALAKIFATLS